MHNLSIGALKAAYQTAELTPAALCAQIREQAEALASYNIFIHLLSEQEQAPYLDNLAQKDPHDCPLWGIPFAIKDNIDLEGVPTTAACEAFAYTPDTSAFVVQKLIDAGAIPVGKTNLDQFATGLNGTRSPWGACANAFDEKYISGGSSSGSAVAVALGLASFSLGTDTAGSGRVPAAFNNLVGVKPSRGLLSSSGMVPACRSLDCMTIFALHTDDAEYTLRVAEGPDAQDAYSRANPFENQWRSYGKAQGKLRLGVIPEAQLKFFGDEAYARAYTCALESLKQTDIECIELDYRTFDEAARLLYEGPWVSERYLATLPLIEEQAEALHPVVRGIIQGGKTPTACSLFTAQYRLEALRKACQNQLSQFDAMLTPTAGRLFTIEEMLAEPVKYNSDLGYYTNFMNLLDMASVAVPAGFSSEGLPFGLTVVGKAFSDRFLLSIANRVQSYLGNQRIGATDFTLPELANNAVGNPGEIQVMVCGAHLQGLPLNWQLLERGARLIECTRTAPAYRMYALAGGPPFRPGLVLDEEQGAAIDVEVWSVPREHFGSFVAGIPAPLGIGKVRLQDERQVSGFICEPCGLEGAKEITHLGGWRAYIETV